MVKKLFKIYASSLRDIFALKIYKNGAKKVSEETLREMGEEVAHSIISAWLMVWEYKHEIPIEKLASFRAGFNEMIDKAIN